MSDVDTIVRKYGDVMVKRTADVIATTSAATIVERKQFIAPEVIGSELTEVESLQRDTIKRKRRMRVPFPEVPRYRYGFLIQSIKGMLESEGEAVAGTDVEYARKQQSVIGKGPGRPFLGVSRDALAQSQQIVNEEGDNMLGELAGLTLDPINISISV